MAKTIVGTRSRKKIPDTPLAKKGLSLKAIMRSTPPLFRNNAEDVVIKSYNYTWTKNGFRAVGAVCKDMFFSQRPHQCTIIGLDGRYLDRYGKIVAKKSSVPPLYKQQRVQLSCPCEAFVFYGAEYALWYHGAAQIKYGNGQPPIHRNPHLVPFMCKHLYKVAELIMSRKE